MSGKQDSLKLKQTICILFALVVLSGVVHAQNLKDDIVNNDLDGLKSKVALLEPDFKAFPYIAHYLKNTEQYEQSMLDYLLEKGSSPDQVDDQGVGPLYYAIAMDNPEAVTTLVTAKANVNAEWVKPKDGYWSSDFKISRETVHEMPLFDAKEIQFTYYGQGKSTLRPLAVALYSRNTDVVPTLLKAGADPLGWLYQIKDDKLSSVSKPVYSISNTVFDHVVGRFATSRGSLEKVDPSFFANAVTVWNAVMALPVSRKPIVDPKLLKNLFAYFARGAMNEFKAELVKTGANTLAFLPYAALAGNWDIVDLIFKYNNLEIDDNFNDDKQSLLAWSIANLHAGAANLLLEHGAMMPASIQIWNDYHWREQAPLKWAASQGKPELVKVLLKFKAEPNEGLSLFFAHSSLSVRKLLLDAGADSNAVASYSGKEYMALTLVQDATWQNKPEAVAFWLDQGLDPNGTGSGQPLVAAVAKGNPELVRLLLAKGAYPGVIIDSDHCSFYQIDTKYLYKPLVEYAKYCVTRLDAPLAKSRANQVVRLLEKAHAAINPEEYKIGATGPAGGLVFFDKGYVSDGWRYLEVAPLDQDGKVQWQNDDDMDIPTRSGFGGGKLNTELIIAAQGSGNYAASLCSNLEFGGFSDWFLPSRDELAMIYANLRQADLGGFSSSPYWSSSQYDDYSAWKQNFSDGYQTDLGKSNYIFVRACRAF